MVPIGIVVGAGCTVSKANMSRSAEILSYAIVSVGQAALLSISSAVLLQAIGQTPAPWPKPKCDLCSRLGIGMDDYLCEWCNIDPTGHFFK